MSSKLRLGDVVLDVATIAAATCAVAVTMQLFWERYSAPAPRSSRTIAEWESHASAGHRVGPDIAQVVIVEWGDYQCPACRRLEPRLRAVRAMFPEEVAVVYRHWPLTRHTAARPAAEAALCADEQERFQAYHEALYRSDSWIHSLRDGFMELADAVGIADLKRFRECLETGPDAVAVIDRDVAAVTELGGTGTPTLMINELLLATVPDSLGLIKLVREQLSR